MERCKSPILLDISQHMLKRLFPLLSKCHTFTFCAIGDPLWFFNHAAKVYTFHPSAKFPLCIGGAMPQLKPISQDEELMLYVMVLLGDIVWNQ